MKKITLLIIFTLIICSPAFASENPRTAIAVIDFKPLGVSASDSIFASEFFRMALVSSKYFRVVEKANMDKLLAEQGFQQTGCTTQECAVQIGKLLNVQNMVTGSFGKFGGMYQIIINLVSIETGEIAFSDSAGCENTSKINLSTTELTNSLIAHLTGKSGDSVPGLGKLSIITDPPGSIIHIDRVKAGISNFSGEFDYEGLKANTSHKVAVSREGYETEVKEVTVEPGESTTLTFRLAKKHVTYEKPAPALPVTAPVVYTKKQEAPPISWMGLKGGILTPASTTFQGIYGDSYPFGFDGVVPINDNVSIYFKNNLMLNFIEDSALTPLDVESASIMMYTLVLGLQFSYNFKGLIPYIGGGIKLNVLMENATFSDYSNTWETAWFVAVGPEYSAGLRLMFTEKFGIFGEISSAVTKTGPAETNIDGLTKAVGIIFEMKN